MAEHELPTIALSPSLTAPATFRPHLIALELTPTTRQTWQVNRVSFELFNEVVSQNNKITDSPSSNRPHRVRGDECPKANQWL